MKLTILKSTSVNNNILYLRSIFFLLGIVCFSNNDAVGQVSTTYSCTQTSLSTYNDLTAGNPLITGAWTDTTAPASINIGSGGTGFGVTAFNFKFDTNSIPSNLIYVSPNGYVTFGTSPGSDVSASGTTPTNIGNFRQPLASALGGSSGAIAVFASRLKAASASSGNISYEVSGTAPNRILKIEWKNFYKYSVASSAWEANGIQWSMQLWLYETTNIIETRYSTQTEAFSVNAFGQIGLRGYSSSLSTMTYINALSYSGSAWPTSPAMASATANTDMVRIRNSVSPTVYVTSSSNRLFQWTPVVVGCSAPPSVTVSNILINTASASFTSTSGTNFQYVLSTSNTAPTGAGTDCTSPLSLTSTSLTANTTYYLWVRTNCGAGGFSSWTSSGAFTTLCTAKPDPFVTPYVQNFDSVSSGVPTCTSTQVVTGATWGVIASPPDTNSSTYLSNYLGYYQTGATANSWFFTEGISMTAGKTYRLSYLYGGTLGSTNKIDIKYGLAPNASSMTNPLDTDSLIKGPGNSNIILFTPSASTVYYFGFKVFSAPFQGFVFLEDIKIDPSYCDTPTALVASNITSTTADVSWTQPASPPLPSYPGYAYYVTTVNPSTNAGSFTVGTLYQILTVGTTDFTLIGASSNTIGVRFTATGVGLGSGTAAVTPTNTTVPTGSVANGVPGTTLTGLATATTYYVWVRSSCGSGDFSPWVSTYLTFTTSIATSYCIPSGTTNSSYISNFKTTSGYSNINNFSSYALPSGYADYTSQIVSQAAGATINFSSITTSLIGFAIWVDWNKDGDFVDAGERVYSSSSTSWVTSPSGSFVIPVAQLTGTYRMRVMIDWFAFTPSPCSLAGSTRRGEIEDYSIKVVTPPPALTLSASSSLQCANVSSPTITLTSSPANYNTYTWSPSTGVIGNVTSGWVFTNATTTVYTLNAIKTATFETSTTTFTYNAANVPSAITITPSTAASCQGGAPVLLTASGGTVANSFALSENFETGATTWTKTNTSTPQITVNSSLVYDPAPEWTIRTNGYNRPPQFTSNDSSSFMLSDSDEQGSGTSTIVTLSSPVFSLANYSSATLNFYHYYRSWTPSSAKVNISIDGGSTWTQLQSYNTVTQGAATSFTPVSIDLNAYLGQTNLKIQFSYNAGWGYYWAIDNVLVSGDKSPQFVWTPTTGLYTNSAGTVPYVADAITPTVYAFPTATTTYTATTSSAANCSNAKTVAVTYYPQAVAGVVSSDQSNCDPAAFTAITLAGPTVGSVIRWEYADNFAFTTNVTSITNTTSTLPTSQFGAFTGSRYFRAVVANGTCANVYSNVVTLSTGGTTWNGSWTNGTPDITKSVAFTSNYTITSNMSACSVQVAAGVSVTVNPGITLTVQNGVTLSTPALASALVFENNSSLLQVNNTTNVGSIVYKRNSTPCFKSDYTYWSSPVASQKLIDLSPNTSSSGFYDYDPAISYWQASNSSSPMTIGKGYLIRVPDSFSTITTQLFTANFTGVPNNGEIPLSIVDYPANRLSLIGNPYPSALSGTLFVDANTLLGGTLYFWTHNTSLNLATGQYIASDYAVWNRTGGTNTAGNSGLGNSSIPSGNIASGQGFFINTISSGTAYFRNTMRLGGSNNTNFYRNSGNLSTTTDPTDSIEKHRIWLAISDAAIAYKQLLVGYIQDGTDGLDRLFDGQMVDNGNQVTFYTMVDEEKLTIQGRGLTFSPNDIFPLGYKSTVATTYSINLSDFDGLFTHQAIYLEDTLLHVTHDLKSGSYTFATEAGTFENRFILRFTNQALGVPVFSENTVVVYKNEEGLHVNSGTIPMSAVAIFDVSGRLIAANNPINNVQTLFTSLPITNQVLLVHITSETGGKITKKVVY